MTTLIFLFLAFTFFTLPISFAQDDPSVYGNFIDDLRTTVQLDFEKQALKWNAVGLVSSQKVFLCDTIYYLGGVNILTDGGYFERTYINLPPHDIIFFVFKFSLMDYWAPTDTLTVYADTKKIIPDWRLGQYTQYASTDYCGGYDADVETLRPVGKFFHTGSSLTVKVVSKKASATSGAFGFRAVNFQLTNRTASDVETSCAVSTLTNINYGIYGCGCDETYFKSGGSCLSCSSKCRECFGPSENQCYGCFKGNGFDGVNCVPCDSACETCVGPTSSDCASCKSGNWRYWDGTCRPTCPAPYVQETSPNKECKMLCQVNGTFTRWDSKCVSTCDEPLVIAKEGLAKLCNYPCLSNQYLNPNGSCLNSCLTPWKINTISGKKFCEYPCPNQGLYYYKSDGICRTDCISPLVSSSDDSGKFCSSPCQIASDFVYSNGSCKSTCPNGWMQELVNGTKMCFAYCNDTTQYFYKSDQVCRSTCNLPLLQTQETPTKLFCESPCQSPLDFLYINGSCQSTCLDGWLYELVNGTKMCFAYCNDTTQYFYKSDQKCRSTCNTPLLKTQETPMKLFCESPCQSPADFLYIDGVCKHTCPDGWLQQFVNGTKMCYATCGDNAHYFYTSDQRCRPLCNPPLLKTQKSTTPAGLFCQSPCSSDQILYHNGLCSTECQAPFILRTIGGVRVCDGPCGHASQYYFEENKICQTFCQYPNQPSLRNGAQFCTLNITSEEMARIEHLVSISDIGSTTTSIGGILASLLGSGDPGALTLTSLVKILQYIKFLDINYPPRLYISFRLQKITPTGPTLAPKTTLDTEMATRFPKKSLPYRFETFGLHSSFIVNVWQLLFSLVIILTVVLVILICQSLFRKFSTLNSILEKVGPVIKWNFFLTILCSNSSDIGLYTAIQLMTVSFENALSVISLGACLFLNIILVFVVVITVKLIMALQDVKKKSLDNNRERKLKSFEKKWENFTILFQGFRNNSLLQQMFMFGLILRAYLTNAIVGFFSSYPLFQTSILTTLSCFMLFYIFMKRPMTRTVNNIQQMFLEVTILIVNVCVLALSIMDSHNIEGSDRREVLGDLIIGTSFAISAVSPVFLTIKLVLLIREHYLEWKAAKSEKRRLSVVSRNNSILEARPTLSSMRLNQTLQLLRRPRLSSRFSAPTQDDSQMMTQTDTLNTTECRN